MDVAKTSALNNACAHTHTHNHNTHARRKRIAQHSLIRKERNSNEKVGCRYGCVVLYVACHSMKLKCRPWVALHD